MRNDPLWAEVFDLFLEEGAESLSVETIADRLDVRTADVFRLVERMDHELTEDDGIVRWADGSLLPLAMSYSPDEAYKWSMDAPEGSVWHERGTESLIRAAAAAD